MHAEASRSPANGARAEPVQPDVAALSAGGLSGYVAAVAGALGLSVAGVHHEVTDTATAYIALAEHSPAAPDRDLMLTWTDSAGWTLAVEPGRPGQAPVVLAQLAGDVLPPVGTVSRFVAQALTGGRVDPAPEPEPGTLADRLAAYRRDHDDPEPGDEQVGDEPAPGPLQPRQERLGRP
jgi:hypothetical protein